MLKPLGFLLLFYISMVCPYKKPGHFTIPAVGEAL
jgi:hypothetical protein